MAVLYDRVRVATATTGTGSLTMGAAVDGYRTFVQASIPTGTEVRYIIEDGLAWEIGVGTYTYPSTLTREYTSSSTGSLLDLTGQATVFIGASAADFPSSFATLNVLDDVTTINAFLQAHAGEAVFIAPGVYYPSFLETGEPIVIPANTTVQALGKVEIHSDNPTRAVFHLEGDGASLIGDFHLIGDFTRPNFGWLAGEWTTWATEWNAANPSYQVSNWLTQSWGDSWDIGNPQSEYASEAVLSASNRTSAVTSYDASNLLIDGLTITNFHTGVCLQGMDLEAADASETYLIQTSNNRVVNLTLDQYDFGILAKKQRDFTIDNISTEWIGHRVNRAQPHVIYLSNSSEVFEYSWNVQCGTINAYNYEGGAVFKARACLNLSWTAINCYSAHSAIAIAEGCTGSGGDVLVTDQHITTDADGAGSKFAVNVSNSPGFMFGGVVRVQQRAGEDQMKGWSVENSDGVRFLQGCEVTCARAASDEYLFRVRSSRLVYSGVTKYTDTNARGTTLFTMSDSQEEGGNASDCVIEFAEVTGTTALAEFVGLSSNNQVWVDPTKVDLWDADLALVDNGLGGGNVLIDPRETVQKILAVSTSTDFSLKAANTLTIQRQGPDPFDEDALPPPYLFSNNDTITIGSTTYTWKTTLTGAANEIKIPDAALVAAYPLMEPIEYGYLQLGFLDAAISAGATTYKGAGVGVIFGTGTTANTQIECDWGGNQFNLRALAAGTGGNSIAVSVSMTGGWATWADGTTSDTLTGGGTADEGLLNQTVHVTASTSDLTMTLPNSAPDGSFIEFAMVDQAGGSLAVQTSAGTALGYIYQSNYPATWRYTAATGWRVDQYPGVYDFNLNGAKADATTDVSTLWATALATAAVEKLDVEMWGGATGYYIPTAPGSVINAAVSNIKSVTYDWISLKAVGGPVTILCGTEVTPAAAAYVPVRPSSTKAFLKANSSTGGTFQMKGTFIIDGNKNPGTSTFSTFSSVDVNAAAALEVTGYDQVLFDDLRVKNTYGNADMRADPDYVDSMGNPTYNATNNPLGSLYKGGLVMDDNGLVKGKLTVGSIWREGPFITASNVRRELEFEYINDVAYATRNPVSTPLNFFGRQKGSSGSLYGPVDADTYSYIKIGAVSGPWKGSLINVGWSGDLVLEGTSEVTGLVPTTTVANDTASATQYGPGIDCSSEVNFGISRSVELRGLRFRDNHRYSLSLARSSSSDKIRRIIGDVCVRGGWSGPNIQNADFLDLVVRCYDCCDYTAAGDYGTALRLYNVGAGDVRIELDGSLQVGAAKSWIGMARQYSDCVVRGRIKDFYLCPISDNNVAGITDNTYNSLYGDMEVVTSTYTTASDGGAIIRIGRSDSNRAKRAEISRVRLDGVPILGTGRANVFAASLPGADSLTLGSGKQSLTSDEFGKLLWVNDDPSSPGAGTKARLYGVTDANGRDAELYAETLLNATGVLQRYPLRGASLRNTSAANYFSPPGYGFGAGTKVLAANTLYMIPWDGHLKTIGLGIDVTSAIASSGVYVALYQGNVEGGVGELVEANATPFDTSSTGLKTFSWDPASTARRRMCPNQWLALVASHAITVRAWTSDILMLQHINGVAAVTDTTGISHWTGSFTYATPPALASLPALTGQTTDAPMIFARRG